MPNYATLVEPIPALLHVGGHTYEIEVVRQRRGRYQVRLRAGAAEDTAIRVIPGARVLRVGVTTSVPVGLVELLEER